MHLKDSNSISDSEQERKEYPFSLCTFTVGANDGIGIDIDEIYKDLFRTYGDAKVWFSVIPAKNKSFAAPNNQSSKCIIIQSYSNKYVLDYPERFCYLRAEKLDRDDWESIMTDIAKHLRNYFRYEGKIVVNFETLTSKESKSIII